MKCDGVEPGWICPSPGRPCILISECGPDCVFESYCGDGVVQAEYEECDDGTNLGAYGGCGPGSRLGPRCGDGILQPEFEMCDDGNRMPYDTCSNNCDCVYVEIR